MKKIKKILKIGRTVKVLPNADSQRKARIYLKIYDPIWAQLNILGLFGDSESCFGIDRGNRKAPEILSEKGWYYLAAWKDGKPFGRCWIKICRKNILSANFYGGFSRHLLKRCLEKILKQPLKLFKVEASCVEGVYTNRRVFYKYKPVIEGAEYEYK